VFAAGYMTVDGLTASRIVGQFLFNPLDWGGGVTVQFEAVLSVNDALRTATIELYDMTGGPGVLITGTSLTSTSLSPEKKNSGDLTLGGGSGEVPLVETLYEVRLKNDGTVDTELSYLGSAKLIVTG
jgi:hypothetical protein